MLSLACVVYRSHCVIAMQRWVNLWMRTSWITYVTHVLWIRNKMLHLLPSENPRRRWCIHYIKSEWRSAAEAAPAPSTNELVWFYTGLDNQHRPRAFPHCVIATQHLVPYSENISYVPNPRHFCQCFNKPSRESVLSFISFILSEIIIKKKK